MTMKPKPDCYVVLVVQDSGHGRDGKFSGIWKKEEGYAIVLLDIFEKIKEEKEA